MNQPNASFLGIKAIDLTTNATVNTSDSDEIDLKPNKGFIYQVIGVYVDIPDPIGSGANDHELYFYSDAFGTRYSSYLEVRVNSGADIDIQTDSGLVGNTESPTNIDEQLWAICERMWASYDVPLHILYRNDTDVNQTGTRTIKLLVKVYKDLL